MYLDRTGRVRRISVHRLYRIVLLACSDLIPSQWDGPPSLGIKETL